MMPRPATSRPDSTARTTCRPVSAVVVHRLAGCPQIRPSTAPQALASRIVSTRKEHPMSDSDAIDHAAALLRAVGFSDPREAVAIHALSASDHLRRAGAMPRQLAVTDTGSAIAQAL